MIPAKANESRISDLRQCTDHTLEVEKELLASVTVTAVPTSGTKGLYCSSQIEDISKCNVYFVTVPTPVDRNNRPDLTPLYKASETVGKVLKKGDIVNIDITVIKNGWHGDTSRMFTVGEGSIAAKRLCQITFEAMWHGILQVKPGAHLGDIGWAIQKFAEGNGYSVVREFCGHGIGQGFHEEPQVLHYGRPGTLDELVPGMIFTIEPMINAGKKDIKELGDRWTIVTRDHSLSAQWEHTVLVTDTGYEVLTLSEGSPALPEFVTTTHC